MAAVGTGRARRRAVLRLGLLAGVLLLAGGLPWVTAGPLPARLIALPLLVAGLLVAAVTVKLRSILPRVRPAAQLVERRCEGCVCGIERGCALLSGDAG